MRCERLLHKAVDTTVDIVEFSQVHVRVEVSDVALYLERTAFRIYKCRRLKNGDGRVKFFVYTTCSFKKAWGEGVLP